MNQAFLLHGRALEALYAVAWTFFEAQRIADATKAFRVMVRFAPTDERAWLGLGACHEELGHHDVAGELYGAGSIVSSPPSVRCLVAASRAARRRGEHAAAEDLLGAACALAAERGDAELGALARADGGEP